MAKYIFITGGVVSSLGKGIASASIGRLLEERGVRVTMQKLDPYLNVDPGTMSPFQHGEVYVTDDGAETDLDLGHYERYSTAVMHKVNNVTTGQIYETILAKERQGAFLGKTVQVIPHVTNEIKSRIKAVAKASPEAEVILTEIGGTVGDIEGLPFLEAIRQFRLEMGRDNVINIHLTLLPYIKAAGELKTKPTQHSVGKLREIGIQPDILICRSEKPLVKSIKQKISLFCNVEEDSVIEARDVDLIYKVPYAFQKQGLDLQIMKLLHLQQQEVPVSASWKPIIQKIKNIKKEVKVAVVGKYINLQDSYKSIYEAMTHGAYANDAHISVMRVDAEKLESHPPEDLLGEADGILIPGGFGNRGIEGKILAAQYARENKIPFFGICLGMQCAVIEFGRNVCGLKAANSMEFDEDSPHPVICLLEEQKNIVNKGGTMRLGAYPCKLASGSRSAGVYNVPKIAERHRHRFEFNPNYKERFKDKGLLFAGTSPDGALVEIIENPEHPWFVACQFHPEFKSKLDAPHPLFFGFLKNCVARADSKKGK